MKVLTNGQLVHRQYLCSPVWQAKRVEALSHYGSICSRCREPGSDVHHRTYERVGGAELMADLEVLCRGCHEAHHTAERCAKTRVRRSREINRQALYRTLTPRQRAILCQRHRCADGQLYVRLGHGDWPALCLDACRMLGMDNFYNVRSKRSAPGTRRPPVRKTMPI
jgi:hypothetical protein